MQAFSELGCELRADAKFTTSALAATAGIGQIHNRLFERLLAILAEDGLLERIEDGWSVCRVPEAQNPESIRAALVADFPEAAAELALIGRCGENLAQVLRGETDALTLLFPDQGLTAAALYRQSPGFNTYNLAVGAMIDKVVAACPPQKTLRILEIGAGTGGVTSHILPRLAPERVEYCFTDVSPHFFAPAKKDFAAYPFVRFQTLDIEVDPAAQGFARHTYDVVIAADVLHATRDLRTTLVNVQRLLSADGLLILLEVTNPPRWADLVFGLTEGWWRFEDLALRPTSALISGTRWSELLPQAGFRATAQFSEMPQAWHTLFAARAPKLSIIQRRAAASWLIFADCMHVGEQIAARLESQGEAPILIFAGAQYKRLDARRFEIDVGRAQDLEQLIGVVRNELPPLRGIVHLWSLDAGSTADTTLASLEEANRLGCVSTMHLVQELDRKNWGTPPRLYLVTSGVHQIDPTDETVAVSQSPLWGLGRVLMNEQPQLSTTLVDIGSAPGSEEIEALFQEVWTGDQNSTATNGEELALRTSARFVHRLNKTTKDRREDRQVLPGQNGFSLFATTPGVLEGLKLRALARHTPGPGEVEIEVRAAGVNFKDVMKALGMLSDAVLDGGFSGHTLGMECAGRIVAVGEQVDNLRIGDEVIAMAASCMGGFVTAPAPLVVQKPKNLAFEDGAAIPVVFLTAYYALIELGRLRRGEGILIHAASGGVGLAAVQLAQQVGAEIFATAGNPEKREFLRKLGVHHVFDSRSLAFADEVMALTRGRGVDVVLNSLAGAALRRSLKLLSPYGRFLEIGKQDIDENTALGLRPFQNNLAFFAIDLDRFVNDRPEAMGTMLNELVRRFEDGSLRPLPRTLFSIENAEEAFRHIAQAKHTGKVVLSIPAQALCVSRPVKTTPIVSADGTYLITGGLGGFGLAVAHWLTAKGARYVVLVGRRGATSDEAKRAIGRLKKAGVTVKIAQADVSREEDVIRVLDEIRVSMPALRGIVHAAMVIDDALVSQLTEDRFRKVMAPKVAGAWNLHLGTLSTPLDFFVMFSSVTALYGNPGQGNYAAANTFLDALAHYRHTLGLPALAVDWGSLAEVGYVSRNADVGRFLERQGLKAFTPQQAFEILDHLLRRDSPQAGAMRLDWKTLAKTNPTGVTSPRFAHLASLDSDYEQGAEGAQRPSKTSRERLMTAEPGERHALLQAHITEVVAGVLGTAPDRLDVERSLTKLGIDSLMAVELSIQIEVDVDLKLPTMSLLQGPSIVELTRQLLGMLAKDGTVSEHTSGPTPEAVPQSPLVPLQRAGSRLPFFCVHPVSGEVNCFLDLASHLPPEQPFYALQTVLRSGSNGHDIGEIAAQYLEAIHSVQPHGPYLLGGYSLGGVIAFEMAHQLRSRGERVELLMLIDSPSPVMNGTAASLDDATLVTWFAQELGVAAGRVLEVSPEELRALDPDAQLAFIWERARTAQTMPADTQVAFLRRKLAQFKANTLAFHSYRPQAYPDEVTFFQATEPLPGHFDSHEHTGTPGWGWARFVDKPLKLETVPGSHHSLLSSPHVQVLAEKLQACLEAAQLVY